MRAGSVRPRLGKLLQYLRHESLRARSRARLRRRRLDAKTIVVTLGYDDYSSAARRIRSMAARCKARRHAASRSRTAPAPQGAVPRPTHVQTGFAAGHVPALLSCPRSSLVPQGFCSESTSAGRGRSNVACQAAPVQLDLHAGDKRSARWNAAVGHAACKAPARTAARSPVRSWSAPRPQRLRAADHGSGSDGTEVAAVE